MSANNICKSSVIIAVFLAIVTLGSPLLQNADSATITPSKKGPKLFASSDPDKNTLHGYYEISVFDEGKWRSAGKLQFGKHYKEKRIEYTRIPNKNGPVKIRLTQKGGGGAHIDSITLGGSAPESIDGKKGLDLKKVSKTDFDVIDAYNKTVEFQFPAGIKNPTLAVTARVEAEIISKEPFKFPVVNTYTKIDKDSSFYIYDLGSNKGRLSLEGKTEELDGHKPLFKEKSIPASGHPEGYTYGYVMNDDENLYAVIDFTGDDTMDGVKDYGKVFVKTKDGVKEFKVSEKNTVWGQHHFLYNDKVSYQHKYYEFKIPLKEIGAGKETEKVMLAFAAYGTLATIAPDPLNIGNVTVGSTGAGVVTFDNTNNVWDLCGISVAGGDAAMFGWSDPDNDCGGAGFIFQINAICNFNGTFSPTSTGIKTTTLTVRYAIVGDCGTAQEKAALTLTMNGTGTSAANATTPTNYNLLRVYKRGAPPAGMGYVYSEPPGIYCPGDGTHISDLAIDSPNTCSAYFKEGTEVYLYTVDRNGFVFYRWEGACDGIWRGAPCDLIMDEEKVVYVRFYPPQPWLMWLKLDAVTGIGYPVPFSDNPIEFTPDMLQGGCAATTVILHNNADRPLNVGKIGGLDPLESPFAITDDTCSDTTLPFRSDCTMKIKYCPADGGPYTDTFDLPSSDPNFPTQTVEVTGGN